MQVFRIVVAICVLAWTLAARSATPSAFERRCIPADCVAPPSNIADILSRRALPPASLAVLGATMDLHHGLLRELASGEQAGRGDATSDIATLPYKLVEWPTPPTTAAGVPGAWNFIQVASVAISPRGTVLVLHRGAHPLMEFESSGKFLRSWGDGLFSEGKVAGIPETFWTAEKSHYSAVYGPAGCASCGAHSVRVDPQGNIWLVDAPGHVIYKMNADMKEVMRLGTKGVSGTGSNTFNLPTDVAFAPNGDLYVSDGYGSQRVVRFTRDGEYVTEWGSWGSGPGQFYLPHNLAIDAQGRVYVTDR